MTLDTVARLSDSTANRPLGCVFSISPSSLLRPTFPVLLFSGLLRQVELVVVVSPVHFKLRNNVGLHAIMFTVFS